MKLQVLRGLAAVRVPRSKRDVGLSGTVYPHKFEFSFHRSHSEVGFLRGLNLPRTTLSGRVISYLPRKFICRQSMGDKRATSAGSMTQP